MDVAEARAWIERNVASDQAPVLDTEEIDSLLDIALLDKGWQADYLYPTGSYITVDDARWVARYGGTSGLTSPNFTGTSVSDTGVTWVPAGDPAWDLYGAVAHGWRLKAGKIAGNFDFSMEGASWSRSQAYDHAIQMAEMYGARALVPANYESAAGRLGSVAVAAPEHIAVGEFGLTFDNRTGSDPRYR